jgi:hypothetical protein
MMVYKGSRSVLLLNSKVIITILTFVSIYSGFDSLVNDPRLDNLKTIDVSRDALISAGVCRADELPNDAFRADGGEPWEGYVPWRYRFRVS